MRIKKLVSAIVSSTLAAIIAVSAIPLTVSAESNVSKLTVCLLNFNISDDPVYPSTVRGDELYDFTLVGKSGTSYSGVQSGSEVVFDNIDSAEFEGATLSYKTDKSKCGLPDNMNFEFLTFDDSAGKYKSSGITLESYKLMREYTEETKKAIEEAQSKGEDVRKITPTYTNNYMYTLDVSLVPSGLNSVFIADSHGSNDPDDLIGYWDNREEFALQNLAEVSVTAEGTKLQSYFDYTTSIVYFIKPDELHDKPTEINIMGFYSDTEALYTAEFVLDPADTCVSYHADNNYVTLGIDAQPEFSPDDVIDEDEIEDDEGDEDDYDNPDEDFDPIVDDDPEFEEDTVHKQAIFNLTSKLNNYDKSLVEDFNTWLNICNALDKDKTLLADSPSSFGGFDLAESGKEVIKLLAGNYVPKFSDMLIVEGIPSFTIGNQDMSFDVTADAKYSLKVTGTGALDYSINDIPFKTKSGHLFLVEPNKEYILIDNTTGNIYKAMATADKPRVTVDFTSKTGLIDNIDTPIAGGTVSEYEDVPNTSDNILLLIFLPLLLLIPIGVVVIITIKKNRKAGGDND